MGKKRKSFRQLWRKQKLLWKWKKTKFCVLNLSLLKSDRKLIDVLLRRKMNSTIPGKTMPVLWILLEHQSKLNSVLREGALELRNSLKMKPVPGLRLVSKLEFLSARLLLFLEKLRRAKPFLMELIVLSANCKGTLQIHVLQSTICKQSMDAI